MLAMAEVVSDVRTGGVLLFETNPPGNFKSQTIVPSNSNSSGFDTFLL